MLDAIRLINTVYVNDVPVNPGPKLIKTKHHQLHSH